MRGEETTALFYGRVEQIPSKNHCNRQATETAKAAILKDFAGAGENTTGELGHQRRRSGRGGRLCDRHWQNRPYSGSVTVG